MEKKSIPLTYISKEIVLVETFQIMVNRSKVFATMVYLWHKSHLQSKSLCHLQTNRQKDKQSNGSIIKGQERMTFECAVCLM